MHWSFLYHYLDIIDLEFVNKSGAIALYSLLSVLIIEMVVDFVYKVQT